MKKKQKKVKIKGIINVNIRVCPVCGFSFKSIDPKTKKKVKICPMCGHMFIDPDIFPKKPDQNDYRFL
ncbi:MAG: hypothetical protein ACFFHD_04550 [Promethearchaeota archaeon]